VDIYQKKDALYLPDIEVYPLRVIDLE